MSLSRLLAVALKELRQIRRDRLTLFILAGLPALMVLLFGYALSLDVDHIPLALCDRDGTAASRDLLSRFTSAGTFDLEADAETPREVERLLDRGAVRAGLVIPAGFERSLEGVRGARVELLLDGADSNTARIAQGYAAVIGRSRATEVIVAALARTGATIPVNPHHDPIETRAVVWFNPELRSANFVIPGLLGVVLLVTSMMMTAMAIVRERERGTLEALVTSPVRPVELILGKTAPYVAFAYLDLGLAMLVARAVFGVPFRGDPALFVGVVALFLLGALGYGLLISTIARSQQEAWTLGLMSTLLPSFLLSGFVFPIENMIAPVQWVTHAIQARYFIAALRAIVLKGVGLGAVRDDVLALAVFALAFPALAAARFKKRLG